MTPTAETRSVIVAVGALVLVCVAAGVASVSGESAPELPRSASEHFSGSGNCAVCHGNPSSPAGAAHSIPDEWRPSMMANAGRDPFWQAKLESEVASHPKHRAIIEDKCTTCHIPVGHKQALLEGNTRYTFDAAKNDPLAMDGVNCTLCHQIGPPEGDVSETFTGNYNIGTERRVYGPSEVTQAMAMEATVNFRPEHGGHVRGSQFCASCHTLITPYFDDDGQIAGEFYEQTPYLEWAASSYPEEDVTCQRCHMPPSMTEEEAVSRHNFVGANILMLRMLRDNIHELGVTASHEQFDALIEQTAEFLRTKSVELTASADVDAGTLEAVIGVRNITGHKLPTAYPARRMWLRVRIRDAAGDLVFESGGHDGSGHIHGCETGYQPHHDVITSADEVQVYESILKDVNDEQTFVLLRAKGYLKDNRIPPRGLTPDAELYEVMAVRGAAETDADFNRDGDALGTGEDRVTYRIDVTGRQGPFDVEAELLYQSTSPENAEHVASFDTPAARRFARLYESVEKQPVRLGYVSTSTEPYAVPPELGSAD